MTRNPGCSLSVPFGKQSCTLSRKTSRFVPHDGENETMTELLLFDSWLTFLDALVWKEELDEQKKTKQKQTITKQEYSFTVLKPCTNLRLPIGLKPSQSVVRLPIGLKPSQLVM